MMVFCADSTSKTSLDILRKNKWGILIVSSSKNPQDIPWALDNGAYGCFKNKKPWDEKGFLNRIDTMMKYPKPVFGVVPDIVGGGLKSLDFSVKWIDKLPKEWDWYLAVQDGMKMRNIVPYYTKFKGIFLGGSNQFKSTAWIWATFAHANNMKFHYARASTRNRIHQARFLKADSLDSAFPFWIAKRRMVVEKALTEHFDDLFYNKLMWNTKH